MLYYAGIQTRTDDETIETVFDLFSQESLKTGEFCVDVYIRQDK